MRLSRLVAAVHEAFDPAAAMADVVALCRFDRYQASDGIDAAADHVAERAVAAGLAEVTVLRFPADGARRWWTFAAPVRWTPVRASVRVAGRPVIGYPEQPYALAAYSAGTGARSGSGSGTAAGAGMRRLPVVRWSAGARPDPAGALVVLDGVPLPTVVDALVAGAAAGVVADPLAGRVERWPDQVGRIELPAGCPLFAFSTTPERLAAVRAAGAADVEVVVDTGAGTGAGTLPVVTGVLRGDGPAGPADGGELLLSAHLCHPMPGANDNASGVAALLGLARAGPVLARGAGRSVRFVWGPEFVGMAAYLHDVVHAGRAARPVAAVNVDLAGEDQRRCGGPLVVERAPDELPSPISAVAERCAELMPAAARSYSGAVPCDPWAWRATPYVGASDHAVLTAAPTGCPAVGLGHWPDLANHTSADTVDLVDPAELRRTATIAGATIAALRTVDAGVDDELAADVARCTLTWAARHVLGALTPGEPAPGEPATALAAATAGEPVLDPSVLDPSVLDPSVPDQVGRRVRHRGAVAQAVVRSLGTAAPPATEEWITGLTSHVATLVPAGAAAPEPPRTPADGDILAAAWPGPFNLRHLGECADADGRAWLAAVAAADRGGSYARLLALARGIDGRRDRRDVAWWAAVTGELAIPVAMADRFLELLCRTGWARPTTGDASC